MKVAESELTFRDIMGLRQQERSGLGLSKPLVTPKGTHMYGKYVSVLTADIDKEKYLAVASQLHL